MKRHRNLVHSGTMRAFIAFTVVVLVGVCMGSVAVADVVRLRHMLTDANGNFTVLMSVLDDQREPFTDPSQLPTSGIIVRAGDAPAELGDIELAGPRGENEADQPTLTLLRDYEAPIRLVIMLPNTNLFTGFAEQDPDFPDQSELRRALLGALQQLPSRSDISIQVGLYNDEVRWLPVYNTEQLTNLRAELEGDQWLAQGSSARTEDPFTAIDNAYRTRLRRQSREAGSNDFITFFIVVSSGSPRVDEGGELGQEAQSRRTRLSGNDVEDVVTMTVVYRPGSIRSEVIDPALDPYRFAMGVTPESGTYRLESNTQGIRSALQQTIDEINSSMVLRFHNNDLEPDQNYYFQLSVTPDGGSSLESNTMTGSVQERDTNWMGIVLIIGLSLIGLLLIVILIVWFIKRPKKEVEEAPVIEEQVQLCVQCGRALRPDLQYCHHCAAEPNYGLIKVLEGPEAGWTFFIREVATDIGTAIGNSIRISDPGVSGNHLKITVQDGRRYLIEDLKSSNGTFIEGARVDKQYLKNGDVIICGASTKLKFSIS